MPEDLEIALEALPGIGILALLMSVDIASGLIRCAMTRDVMSKRLAHGVSIKAGILVIVTLAFVIDIVVVRFVPWAKPYAPVYVGKVVAAWYMLVELLSILENLHKMGVPMPQFLTKFLAVAKEKIEGSSVHIPKVEVNELTVKHSSTSRRGRAREG